MVSGSGKKGIAASGIAYSYVKDVLSELNIDLKVFKVGNPYPIPRELAESFMNGLDEVLVFEELDPLVEEALIELTAKNGGKPKVLGKKTGNLPCAGEYSFELVKSAIMKFIGLESNAKAADTDKPNLPARPPVLCAGCPHRGAFYTVKMAMKKRKAVFTGDIGCYTLGNAKPLDMVDTCLCMGAGITIAQGLQHVEPDSKHIAFIGDSTFFHTGVPGIINAVYNNADITVVILDNSTTAMTGHQPHPGTGKTMMGSISEKIDIFNLVKACGVKHVVKANPFELEKSIPVVQEAVNHEGPSVVIFEAPCIALFKPEKTYTVREKCISCKKCINEIGCPAISMKDGKAYIEPSLCYGCDLCAQVCPIGAIGGASK
jgi:indolepyruvate ferredoxin oxidoreductase alpha subunit